MADTESTAKLTNQYLDKVGLEIFYGIIKDQWTNADTALETKLLGTAEDAAGSNTLYAVYNAVVAEKNRAEEIEGNLQEQITANTGLIEAEVTRATEEEGKIRVDFAAADTALETKLLGTDESKYSTIKGVGAALEAEVTRATAAEGKLTEDLAAEVTRATEEEGKITQALTDAIAQEVTDRNEAIADAKEALVGTGTSTYTTIKGVGDAIDSHKAADFSVSLSLSGENKLKMNLSGAHTGESNEIDMTALVLDNYINNIEYFAEAESGVSVAAPYIKFTWKLDEADSDGFEDKVLRISVADLVGAVEAGDNYIDVTASNAGLDDNTASNYKVSISQAFIDKIWGDDKSLTMTGLNTAISNEVDRATAAEAALLGTEDNAYTSIKGLGATFDTFVAEQATKDQAQDQALEEYKTTQAAKDAAQDKALTDHVAEFETFKTTQAAKDQEQDKALADYKTAQATKDAAQDQALEEYKTTQATKDAAQDQALTDAIAAEEAARGEAINAEKTAREEAINAEKTAREEADTALDEKITGLRNEVTEDLTEIADKVADLIEGSFEARVTALENWVDTNGVITEAEIKAICGITEQA